MATDMEKFHNFADNSALSILLTDCHIDPPGPRIIYANANLLKMTGYSLDELLEKTSRIFQGAKTDRAVLDKIRQCLIDGTVFAGATVNYRKDGGEFLMSWTVEPIFLDGVKYFYAIQTDITNGLLKALEEVKTLQLNLLSKLPENQNVSNSRQSLSGSDAEGAFARADQSCCQFDALR
jgi:PAS domain S-box-containing protein